MKYIFLVFLFFFLCNPLWSQENEEKKAEEVIKEPTFYGFILDKTKSKIGRDFFENFSALWEFPPGTEHLNIVIDEQSDPRWGSQILIFVEDTLVYYTLLKPRLEDIDQKAEEAVQVVFNYLMDYLKYQKYLEEEKFM
jgi:curli production assembly/transport component CsgE